MTRFEQIEDSIGGRPVTLGHGIGANEEQSTPLVRTGDSLKQSKRIVWRSVSANEMSSWRREDCRRPQ